MKSYLKYTILVGLVAGTGLGSAQDAKTLNVGVMYAYSAQGKNDRAFNQAMADGMTRASQDFPVKFKEFIPSKRGVDAALERFSKEPFDMVVGVSFEYLDLMNKTAALGTSKAYVLVDAASDKPNVNSIIFREEEGSYMVGYLAALKTSTGSVGFVGGMNIPVIQRFEAGYTAGARAARPGVKVYSAYIGNTPAAFDNPKAAQRVAEVLKKKGVDIIFSAAGVSGNGVIEYVNGMQCLKASELPQGMKFTSNLYKSLPKARTYNTKCAGDTRPMFFIGVDINQNYLGDTDKDPKTLNHGLTSMVKNVDVAVYSAIRGLSQGNFKTGVVSLGLNEGGVGYSVDKYNGALISKGEFAKLQQVVKEVGLGNLKVPIKR